MNILEKKLIELKDYNIGFNVCDEKFILSIVFPEKWYISEPVSDNIEFYKDNENNGKYYYISHISQSLNNLFNEIEIIIKYNNELESKTLLFKEKLNELKDIFTSNDLSTLKTLQFKLKKKKSLKTEIPKDENNSLKQENENDMV